MLFKKVFKSFNFKKIVKQFSFFYFNMQQQFQLVLRTPYTMTIAGPTKCGKTSFVNNLIKNSDWLYESEPNKFYYFYNSIPPTEDHDAIHSMVTEFIEGVPSMEWMEEKYSQFGKNVTVIIDDQDLNLNKDIAMLFNVGSSHFFANFIFITHNIFGEQKEAREISLNSDYYVLCKQIRDKTQIRRFFSQHHPVNPKAAMAVYNDATRHPFSYLLLDFHQKTQDDFRMLDNIFFENNEHAHVYTI